MLLSMREITTPLQPAKIFTRDTLLGSLGFRQYFTKYLIYSAIFMVHANDGFEYAFAIVVLCGTTHTA
jgi:hypothetical protein